MCEYKVTIAKRKFELGDIMRMHGESYCQNNILPPQHHKVLNALCNCRTKVLGGHVDRCDNCGHTNISYDSCRNRHCPKCQSLKTLKWLEERQKELLPVPYFHVVFTLPHELNILVMYNKKELYSLLMRSVWETIKTFGEDPKRLNGLMGMIAILHTWGQNLFDHIHLHCMIPGGALQDNNKWRPSKPDYLFSVKAMSIIFRGIFITGLRTLYDDNKLKIPSDSNVKTSLGVKANFETLLSDLMKKSWVVYSKHPFAGPKQLLNYLGRYINKIAISNYRIISCDEQAVKFSWRDYADNNTVKIMTLKPEEFIRRFLMHVVPAGFIRVRFFGFLANACKKKNIDIIRKMLDYTPVEIEQKKDIRSLMFKLTGNDIALCPHCKKGHLYLAKTMPNTLTKLTKTTPDTS